MDYREAVHKFQALHIWGPTTKAEIVEAIVDEAVRRTMEQVTGRVLVTIPNPDRQGAAPNADAPNTRVEVLWELLNEAWADSDAARKADKAEQGSDKANERIAELEKTIEGLREWAKELHAQACREYDRTPFLVAWDASTRDRMKQVLARLPAKEASDVTT